MKRFFLAFMFCLTLVSMTLQAAQSQRRPVDSQHPLWMVHVDVWNQADPQKIIDLIPADIRPYVCINLSLSCSYDTNLNIYRRPQNGVMSFKSWATVCQLNGCWFTCQPASGGHTHIQDDDLETFEYFFKAYPNFLGWNYAEQFWGFGEAGDRSSSTDESRIALFAKLVPMHHEYGGFLTISFCGNIWSHHLNPMGMMKRNSDLYNACKAYPDAILWLYKYTTSSCFYNNESVTFAPFVAGLAQNYGVRYDNCGWNGAIDDLVGTSDKRPTGVGKYPGAAGIGTIMEQTCVNGGAVWDGPELIWTEDFENLSNTWDGDGYAQRRWGTFPNFRNIWIDMFRKIIDGTLYIPTRAEVVAKTKIYLVNDLTTGDNENQYASYGSLYDGLYKTDDPFNRGNGQWMNNYNYLKQSGRYGTIPVGLAPIDAPSGMIQVKKSALWSSDDQKVAHFNMTYPEVSEGDLYVNRYRNQLVTYNPYTYLNSKRNAEASIPLKYNTCETLKLNYGLLSAGYIREYADRLDLYLNNFRADTTDLVTDVISLEGVTGTPNYSLNKRAEAQANVTASLNGSTYTLTVSHNGPIDLTIQCQGNATGRATDVLPKSSLPIPVQPSAYTGTLTIEAEDMDYKGHKSCQVTPYYSEYQSVRGFTGNGFIDLGTGTGCSLRHRVALSSIDGTLAPNGSYTLSVRYTAPKGNSSLSGDLNGTALSLSCPKTETNEWKYATAQVTLASSTNVLTLNHTDGVEMYVDNISYLPAGTTAETYSITIGTAEHGTVIANVTTAAPGTTIELTVTPEAGCELTGWQVLRGSVTLSQSGDNTYTFTMPDDKVEIVPIFEDLTTVYRLDFSSVAAGKVPSGWRCVQENGQVHDDSETNGYNSGARTLGTFTGYQKTGLYWRYAYTEYGANDNASLLLSPGKYKLSTAMASWNGNHSYKISIYAANDPNLVILSTDSFDATPNVAENQKADVTSATQQVIEFEVPSEDYYVIRYTANNPTNNTYMGYVLLSCAVNCVETYSAPEETETGTEVFHLDFSNVADGTVPSGWTIVQENGDSHESGTTYYSGSRTFIGLTAYQEKGVYWRCNRIEYGTLTDESLELSAGEYSLSFVMAAWKGTPSFNVSVLSLDDESIIYTTSKALPASPNMNGEKSADLSAAKRHKVTFTIPKLGKYIVRFTAVNPDNVTLIEYMLLDCTVRQIAQNNEPEEPELPVEPEEPEGNLPNVGDLIYQLDYTNVASGGIPTGWTVTENEVRNSSSTYSTGPRTFVSFSGDRSKSLYWRGKTEYGTEEENPLTLQPGAYTLTYAMAAWKNEPQYNVSIVSIQEDDMGETVETVIATKEQIYALPNVNGNGSANLSIASEQQFHFTITEKGNYVIRFANSSQYAFSEYLLVDCQLTYGHFDHSVVNLTGESFHNWTAADASAEVSSSKVYPAYEIGTSTGMPYGDGNVYYLNYADLTRARYLYVTATEGEPRMMFNRPSTAENNIVVEVPRDKDNYETVIENADGSKTYKVDIAKIVATYGFAHLNAIKANGWGSSVTVTAMYYDLNGDIDSDGKVNAIDLESLRNVILGKATGTSLHDLNIDGKTNISDVTTMIKFLTPAE